MTDEQLALDAAWKAWFDKVEELDNMDINVHESFRLRMQAAIEAYNKFKEQNETKT